MFRLRGLDGDVELAGVVEVQEIESLHESLLVLEVIFSFPLVIQSSHFRLSGPLCLPFRVDTAKAVSARHVRIEGSQLLACAAFNWRLKSWSRVRGGAGKLSKVH